MSVSRIRSVIADENSVVRYDGHGDCWFMTWASDNRQLVGLCDGAGFLQPHRQIHNSRMLAISGEPHKAIFDDLKNYPTLARPQHRDDEARYYGFGALAVGEHIYQFLSTFNRPCRLNEFESPGVHQLLRFTGVKLIYSPDNGFTWLNQDGSGPVVWESWGNRSSETMLFMEEDQEAFSMLSVLQMGRNYELNRDGYVYIYAPNGNTEGTMNELVMFRVPKNSVVTRAAYEYFAGFDGKGRPLWSSGIDARRPVHTFPGGWVGKLMHPYSWQPSVVYIAPLNLYLMANWATGSGASSVGGVQIEDVWFVRPSYLGFWVADNPWGPWEQIHEDTAWMPNKDIAARPYQAQIAPKWIGADGKSFWLVWTDFQTVGQGGGMARLAEEHNKSDDPHLWEEGYLRRYVAAMRSEMPYYTFNAQRFNIAV